MLVQSCVDDNVLAVHVIPSGDVEAILVPVVATTHQREPFHATPAHCKELVGLITLSVQLIPSGDVAMKPALPSDRTNKVPFHLI